MKNVLKFLTHLSFCSQDKFVIRAEIHKMLVRIANKDTDQNSLIWVCIVCLGRFGRQLVFQILEHLLYIC